MPLSKMSYLLLGLAFVCSCTRKDAPATLTYPAAKLHRTNTVQIDFLTYSEGKADGNIHPTRIQVGPNPDAVLNVGIAQDLSGGLGGQWQAAVWIAAFQAAAGLGRDLSEYAIMVRGQGQIDGPSAGALFAAGMMAAMAGVPVRADVTMTGIANPDGTVGPVGGIPNKFRAAVKAGKKILGYPVGQRYALDLATQKIVDLQEFAKENGVQAVEISTVNDAFALLTGRQLPLPAPLPPEELALPSDVREMMKKRLTAWRERYEHFETAFYSEKLQNMPGAANRMDAARTLAQLGIQMQTAAVPAAGELFQLAAGQAFSSYAYGRLVSYILDKKFKEMLEEVASMFNPVAAGLKNALDDVPKFTPKNQEETAAFLCALEQTIAAMGYTQVAANSLSSARNVMENIAKLQERKVPGNEILGAIIKPLLAASSRYGSALMAIERGKDFQEMIKNVSATAAEVPGARLEATAKLYLAVAQACLNYIDQIFVPDLARSAQADEDTVRSRLMQNNDLYLLAWTGLRFPQTIIREQWGEKANSTYWAQIAGSMGSYFASSMFLMHHYSLGVEDDGANVRMEKALTSVLDHAERNVRLQAALLKAAHAGVPAPARFFYAVGLALKDQNNPMKLKALEMFWRASMLCRLSLQLTQPVK